MYAIVENDVVTNVIVWDGASDWTPPEGSEAVAVPDGVVCEIGDHYDGSEFTAPARRG
ncbi:hypothetical protein [Paraburkholderia sp. SIMBA_054]|uniref:hypothetical protein n=1 Tax=Paraburkholderia sp. SIMBA_054 TaxID=3085795 RepID=UPI003978277F